MHIFSVSHFDYRSIFKILLFKNLGDNNSYSHCRDFYFCILDNIGNGSQFVLTLNRKVTGLYVVFGFNSGNSFFNFNGYFVQCLFTLCL
jgi:hypothetical protein